MNVEPAANTGTRIAERRRQVRDLINANGAQKYTNIQIAGISSKFMVPVEFVIDRINENAIGCQLVADEKALTEKNGFQNVKIKFPEGQINTLYALAKKGRCSHVDLIKQAVTEFIEYMEFLNAPSIRRKDDHSAN